MKKILYIAAITVSLLVIELRSVHADFEDVTGLAGLRQNSSKSFGNPTWVDFNNDGLLDMVSSQHAFLMNMRVNHSDGMFLSITQWSGRYSAESWVRH